MKSTFDEPAAVATSPLRFVIVYEDFATGIHAKRFADKLSHAFGRTYEPLNSLWRSELLDLPELAREVAGEAAAAEFVLLSLRGDRDLSFGLKCWVESWLAVAGGNRATLITLFDPNRSNARTASSARLYLRDVTSSMGADFFAHCAIDSNQHLAGPGVNDRAISKQEAHPEDALVHFP